MKKLLAFAILVFACFDARAVIPENGWWWNPQTSGSGFNLEIQNDLLFFAAFAYDSNGNPTWLTAGGRMSSDRDFTATLSSYSGGSCYGCSYHAPVSSNAGLLSLHFTSSQSAVLTINGVSENVERFDFWLNNTAPDAMLGEWSMVIGEASQATYFGERVQYRGKSSDSSGPYLFGNRLGSASSPATLRYNSATGLFTSILDSSPSFYRYSEWSQTGFNRIEGTTWLYEKGTSPSGPGSFFQGYRSASAAFVQTGVGPASTKSLAVGDAARTARDQAEAQAAAGGSGPVFSADAGRQARFEAVAPTLAAPRP